MLFVSFYVLIPFFCFNMTPFIKLKEQQTTMQVYKELLHYHYNPLIHANAFVFGMLIGYLIKNDSSFKGWFTDFRKTIIWIISIGSTIWSHLWLRDLIKVDVNTEKRFDESVSIDIKDINDFESLLYISLHKMLFIMGFCCVIFMCCTGRASK